MGIRVEGEGGNEEQVYGPLKLITYKNEMGFIGVWIQLMVFYYSGGK